MYLCVIRTLSICILQCASFKRPLEPDYLLNYVVNYNVKPKLKQIDLNYRSFQYILVVYSDRLYITCITLS